MATPHEVTRLLKEWANGGQAALAALTPLVYAESRRLAGGYLRGERPGHTLQPTAPGHDAFLRQAGSPLDCESRSQFYGVAAHLMGQILIDHARSRQAVKRGGGHERVSFEGDLAVSPEREDGLVALDEGLERLAALDPLKVPEVTVRRDWQFAKAWLLRELSGDWGYGT